MSAILTPVGLLLIILAGYLFKRFGLFGQKDYRVLQTAEFNIVLPGAIDVYKRQFRCRWLRIFRPHRH